MSKAGVVLAMMAALSVMASPVSGGQLDKLGIPLKWLEPLVPEDVAEPVYPDYDRNNALEKARGQIWSGQYRRGLVTLASVGAGKELDVALLRGQALLALGRYDKAVAALTAPAVAADASALTLRSQVLAEEGRYAEAVDVVNQAIASDPSGIPQRYYLGSYKEKSGDYEGAKAAYQWFMDKDRDFLQQWVGHKQTFTSAGDVALIARAIDRWATLNAAYQQVPNLNDVVMSMFVRAYDVIDTQYWPAHCDTAEFYLLHDDPPRAQLELKKALAANPFDTRSWAMLGRIGLAGFNFDAVDVAVARIREVNPDSVDADLLEARNLLLQRVPKQGLPLLEKVLERQPGNIEATGLLAGAYALMLQDDKTAELLRQADALQKNSPEAYFEVAEQLSSMRQYPRAAEMYQVAQKRAPWWAAVQNGLGLLYTQSGDEARSRVELEKAHYLDPYNAKTTNYLRLLDMMDSFSSKETAHFIVSYDKNLDPVIPEYFSDYLESIYPSVCGEYGYEPKVKTLIEVFPTHAAFSVRTTGIPWIATVGASTGRVIALVAPRKGESTLGTFNWSQVLRHEFTHTVTLGETDNRIAHWFTEGLAVSQEHTPLRWEWVPMLYLAVKHDELFPMESLTWAFVRPRRASDRALAYAESFWICQYIEQTYGHQAILKMLEQFKEGKGQDDVIANSLGRSEDQFFKEFTEWCKSQIAGWGYDEATSKKYEKLRDQAEELKKGQKYAEAAVLWEQIVKMRPVDIMPHQRLAGLYLVLKQPEKAAEQLDALAAVELKNNMYAKQAARLYRDMGKLDVATQRALKAVYIDPYDQDAHETLAELYEKAGNSAGMEREARVIAELQKWKETMENGGGSSGQPN